MDTGTPASNIAYPITEPPWSSYRPLANKTSLPNLQVLRPCPFCSSLEHQELFGIEGFQFFGDTDGSNRIHYRVAVCSRCDLVFTNPWMTYEGQQVLLEKSGCSYGRCDPEERMTWVRSHFQSACSILDIGCGRGEFLNAFPPHIRCVGVDIDEISIGEARQRAPQVEFHCGDFEPVLKSGAPDVITLFHVLEHFTDPLDTLVRLRTYARPETHLVVEVPVLDRAAETQGEDVCGFFSLSHRSHFSKIQLARFLSKSGWKIKGGEDLIGNGYRVIAEPGVEQDCVILEEERTFERALIVSYMTTWNAGIARVRERINSLPPSQKILIWGAGHHTEYLARLTALFDRSTRFLIVDKDPLKWEMRIHGIPVLNPDDIPKYVWQDARTVAVVSSFMWRFEIERDLLARGVNREGIYLLYP